MEAKVMIMMVSLVFHLASLCSCYFQEGDDSFWWHLCVDGNMHKLVALGPVETELWGGSFKRKTVSLKYLPAWTWGGILDPWLST